MLINWRNLWKVNRPIEVVRVSGIFIHVLVPLEFIVLIFLESFLPVILLKKHGFVMPVVLIGKSPHVGIDPCQCRESSRPDPYIHEPFRVGMWHSRVTPVCVSKVLLHFLLLLLSRDPLVFSFISTSSGFFRHGNLEIAHK